MIVVQKTAFLHGAGLSAYPLQFIQHPPYPPDLLVLLQKHGKQKNLQWQQMICLGAGHHMFGDVSPQFIEGMLVFRPESTAKPAKF
jgi:hypothetical protein